MVPVGCFAEIPLSVFPQSIEKINLFAVFGYSQQTEYIRKAIQEKNHEQRLLQTQNATSTIAFRGQDVQSNESLETENSGNRKIWEMKKMIVNHIVNMMKKYKK